MPLDAPPLEGLIAAAFTPLTADGSVNISAIPPMVDRQVDDGIQGLYVLGSTGEGPSLTFEERCAVAKAFVDAAASRLPVIVQCGCESLAQARQLAAHAQQVGASAVSAVTPVYFKPDSVETLVDSMAHIAAGAPKLPFYHYHIPAATGVAFSMLDFLRLGAERIPTLRGLKYTSMNVFEFQACLEFAGGKFEVLWGLDEMLLSGLVSGARAGVGSTYNFAPSIYRNLLAAFADGDLEEARRQQSRSQALVRTFIPYGPRSAQKAIMAMVGLDCGPSRLPVRPLADDKFASLHDELVSIGFFNWIAEDATAQRASS